MILRGAFNPRAIGELALWLDGADSPSQWLDKSAYARTAVQLATNNQPAASTLNGRKALYFDGINDTFALPVIPMSSWHAFVAHSPANSGTLLYVAASSTQSFSVTSAGTARIEEAAGGPQTAAALYAADSRVGAGWEQGALKGFYKGVIGEVIVFSSSLAPAQSNAVARYLSRKWGL